MCWGRPEDSFSGEWGAAFGDIVCLQPLRRSTVAWSTPRRQRGKRSREDRGLQAASVDLRLRREDGMAAQRGSIRERLESREVSSVGADGLGGGPEVLRGVRAILEAIPRLEQERVVRRATGTAEVERRWKLLVKRLGGREVSWSEKGGSGRDRRQIWGCGGVR